MAGPFDFTGQNIEDSYQRVLQTDGTNVYDGTGSLFTLPGVSQIIAGGGILVSPSTGVGDVTITATAATYNTATGSYGSFYDTGSQTAVLNTAIYSMSLSTTDISNGVLISGSDNSKIKFTNAGVYNVQFSAQFANNGNDPTNVAIWLRKNNGSSLDDLPDTTGTCTIPAKKGNIPGTLITSWNYYISLAANDFLQLLWAADVSNTVSLETLPSSSNPIYPRTPSLILTAQRVDTFLSNTGSFSGSFTGEFTGSLLGTSSFAINSLTASFIDGGTF
jgi:hypothetical protein